MLDIKIDEEVATMDDMVFMLEECIRRIQNGARASYEPNYFITGEEEPEDADNG